MTAKWDERFLDVAALVAEWSKDPSTKVGAVIVRPDRTIASVGYNGFPMGLSDAEELYADKEEKYSRIVHAEMNALLHCKEPVKGYTLYTFPLLPCDRCAAHFVQAGISRVVSTWHDEDRFERWADSLARSEKLFNEAGIRCVKV